MEKHERHTIYGRNVKTDNKFCKFVLQSFRKIAIIIYEHHTQVMHHSVQKLLAGLKFAQKTSNIANFLSHICFTPC